MTPLPAEFRDCLYFPCYPNKHPATPNGFKDATSYCDPTWQTVGMVLVGNLFVLDVDVKAASRGDLTLAELESLHGDLPPTYAVRTPSGGYHFYYTVPPGTQIPSSNGKIGEGLDVRGNMGDGFVIAPGSWASYQAKDGSQVEGYYTCL